MEERLRTGYRYNAVDIHSHIIPGVDDGAKSIDEAIQLIKLDREEGISAIFATPHYGSENIFTPDRKRVQIGFEKLQEEIRNLQKLYSGRSVCQNGSKRKQTESDLQ